MKRITGYYKRLRLRKIEIAVLAVFVSIFFLPFFVPFEKTGNNVDLRIGTLLEAFSCVCVDLQKVVTV